MNCGKGCLYAVILLAGMLWLGGCSGGDDSSNDTTGTAYTSAPARESVEAYGKITAEARTLTLPSPAEIVRLSAVAGQRIKKGDELVELRWTNREAAPEAEWINGDKLVCPIPQAIVGAVTGSAGELVGPGAPAIRLYDLDTVHAEVNVDQQFIGLVHLGDPVQIVPETDPSAAYTGSISFVSSNAVVVNGETVVPVRIAMEQQPEVFILNSDVRVMITQNKAG